MNKFIKIAATNIYDEETGKIDYTISLYKRPANKLGEWDYFVVEHGETHFYNNLFTALSAFRDIVYAACI